MGVLTVADFEDEILSGLGNRTDISINRIVRALNLAQGRIGRSYDFSEMSVTAFAQMNFTQQPALDKYMVPPPRTKTIHSFVLLDTSSANGAIPQPPAPPSSGVIALTGDDGTVLTGDDGAIITGDPTATVSTASTTGGTILTGDDGTVLTSDTGVIITGDPGGLPPPTPVPPSGTFANPIGSLGQSRKVVEKPWRWFDAHFPAPEWLPAGWPEIYKRFGNIITMVPPPFLQFTAQLSYTQYATPFTTMNLNQVSDYENKDDVIVEYALAWFFKGLGRNDRAVYFEGLAKEQLDEAIEKDDTRPDIEVSRDIPAVGGAAMGPYWAMPFVKSSP